VLDGQDLCPGTPAGIQVDANGCSAFQRDVDGDGYEGSLGRGEDCNDHNAAVNPEAAEVCADGIDNDCDGLIDEHCGGLYNLLLSASSNRSGPVVLDGRTASGDIYVFTGPDTGVKQVLFYLDGVLFRTEAYPPYDFNMTAVNGLAVAFDTNQITDGRHQITAVMELTNGTTKPRIFATFTVNNQ
jgi:hypothetical protein